MKTIYGGSATPTIKPGDKDTARSLVAIGRAIQREMKRAGNNADIHHFLGKEDEVNNDLQRFRFLGEIADKLFEIADEQGYDMNNLLGIKEYDDVISVC